MNLSCINITLIISKFLKYIKNKKVAKGNAKANLVYVDAIVEISLLSFFWIDDLKFWKKAAKIVTIIQFIE